MKCINIAFCKVIKIDITRLYIYSEWGKHTLVAIKYWVLYETLLCNKRAPEVVLKTHIVEEVSIWAEKLTRPIDDSK